MYSKNLIAYLLILISMYLKMHKHSNCNFCGISKVSELELRGFHLIYPVKNKILFKKLNSLISHWTSNT